MDDDSENATEEDDTSHRYRNGQERPISASSNGKRLISDSTKGGTDGKEGVMVGMSVLCTMTPTCHTDLAIHYNILPFLF